MAQAETAREAGDWALVDDCLNQASQLADEDAQQQAQKARDAARQAAAVLASRGALALTRLEREAGARFFAQAFERRKLDVDSESLWWLLKAGDALRTAGNTAGALRLYRQAQQAAEAGGEVLRRDLAASVQRVGDVLVMQGDLTGARKAFDSLVSVTQALLQEAPRNTDRQRNLSVSHDRVGDVQVAQGDLAAALKSYQAGLAIRQTLARVDLGNRRWQRDLSISHEKVGDVQVVRGDLAGALKSYQASLEIAQTLARVDPGNAQWQVNVAITCWKLGQKLGSAGGSTAQRQAWFQQGLGILQNLHREGRLAPNRQAGIGMFERALAALK
jgi:tetratricopeptide (TPR) repeat protein